jgi:hypothetical protein
MRKEHKTLVGKTEGKRPLERLRSRWEDNILMGGSCGLHSSGSGEGPVAGSCEYGNEPSGSTKDGEFLHNLFEHQLLEKGSLLHGVSAI